MYQFNYQTLLPEDKPIITCIVPQEWLSKDLPTMGGVVMYVDKSVHIMASSEFVFEFSEVCTIEKSIRTVNLDILEANNKKFKAIGYKKLLDAPATIRCRAIEGQDANNDWCIEIVLLNHLFGSFALTASFGNVYLDFADLLAVLSMSSEYDFEFGIGETPQVILPGILERMDYRKKKCSFGMMFGRGSKIWISHLKEMIRELHSLEGVVIVTDIAVDQELMLISVLAGR